MKKNANKPLPVDRFKVFETIKNSGLKLNYLCKIGGLTYNNVTTQMCKDRVLPETAEALKKAIAAHITQLKTEIKKL